MGAVLGTYLSDLGNIIQFAIRICFYLSPILYSVADRIPDRFIGLYMLVNPFAGLMESYKSVLIRGEPPTTYILVGVTVAIAGFLIGLWYFTHDEHKLVKAV
jgi:ABC-type polysaccharide/polyol phosphate export permease